MNTNKTSSMQLTPEILQEIDKIKIKFRFREDIDLVEHLKFIKSSLELIEDHESQKNIIVKRKILKKRIKLLTQLIDSFDHDFDFVEHESFLVNLENQNDYFEKELNSLATKKGAPTQSSSYRCAAFLLKIFSNGTVKKDEPPLAIKCWNPTKKANQKDFYGFINDILPLMLKMGIEIKASNETIVEYASKIVSPTYCKEFTPRRFENDIAQNTYQSIDDLLVNNSDNDYS